MQRYPVRASHRKNLEPGTLSGIVAAHFGAAEANGPRVATRFGAISSMTVGEEAKQLAVEMVMDPKVGDDVARETIARYNKFLEAATGYSAKERAKRLRKSPDA